MATSVLLPFVVAALAILTKTVGRSVPPTRARPEDLRKKRLSIMNGFLLPLKLRRAENQPCHRRQLRVVPRILCRRFPLNDSRFDGASRLLGEVASGQRLRQRLDGVRC